MNIDNISKETKTMLCIGAILLISLFILETMKTKNLNTEGMCDISNDKMHCIHPPCIKCDQIKHPLDTYLKKLKLRRKYVDGYLY